MTETLLDRSEWIERFAARLMLFQPWLNAVTAAGHASFAYDEGRDLDPREAAESFLAQRAPGDCESDDDNAAANRAPTEDPDGAA